MSRHEETASSKDAPHSLHSLRKMPRNVAEMIMGKIGKYAADPASLASKVKALEGEQGSFACG